MKNKINSALNSTPNKVDNGAEEENSLFARKLLETLDKFGDRIDAHYLCSAPTGGCHIKLKENATNSDTASV